MYVHIEAYSPSQRLEQLRAKGTTISLIDHLSADAQAWAELRSVLRGQIKSAKAFVDIHCRSYDQDEGQSTMQAAIDEFAAEVNEQIASSDKTVKELLQFVSIWDEVSREIGELTFTRNLHGCPSTRRIDQQALLRVLND